MGALAKQFPNVYADLCWMHTISPNDTRTALSSWLDTVPVCKILGFGDDVHGVEAVAGQLYCARDNICRVLAAQAETGLRDMEECEYIMHRILLIIQHSYITLDYKQTRRKSTYSEDYGIVFK